jgi:hypothetical protein
VLEAMGENPEIPVFEMYTEVIQDAVIKLMKQGKIRFASGCSLTVTNAVLKDIYDNLEFFRSKFVLRPQEISNSPEVVRRLGIISINTAIEVDIAGNVNSTHVLGRNMMNGIGGSGDFARNAFLSIFTCPSTAKGGKISTIVPLVCHLDHSEHSVQIIVTEQGVADLRGKSPTSAPKPSSLRDSGGRAQKQVSIIRPISEGRFPGPLSEERLRPRAGNIPPSTAKAGIQRTLLHWKRGASGITAYCRSLSCFRGRREGR